MQLEKMFGYQPRLAQEQRRKIYFVVGDLEGLSASALYGDMDRGYDFKNLGFQLHIHEDSKEGITGAHLKKYGEDKPFLRLSNYETLMGEIDAINLGIPKIKIGS
ncbi:MAG: hypothetical protein QXO70_05170 [Candidatus Pacearchaeota archaeon]